LKIIKLSAIDSTNSFLKELATNSVLENFTTVATDRQITGRGQQGSNWESEPFKNLIFSVFVSFDSFRISNSKCLNFAVSLAIFEVLMEENIPDISIKWPNDILSGKNKICGILIENRLKGKEISSTIIGIGLNVNQTIFSSALQKASSLKLRTNQTFDLDVLLKKIISKLKNKIALLNSNNFEALETSYLNVLYKKNIPTMFKDSKDVLFMGIICGISKEGKLQVALEDETLKEFGIKEISFL
jgi:BirA family biotin operon repressor/biotin-[acetyl-CoA-carboxylase] ligase